LAPVRRSMNGFRITETINRQKLQLARFVITRLRVVIKASDIWALQCYESAMNTSWVAAKDLFGNPTFTSSPDVLACIASGHFT